MKIPAKEIKNIEKEILPLYEQGKSFTVKSEGDKQVAADLRGKLKDALKLVEERRTAITKPINDSLKSINDLFRPFKEKLEGSIKIIDQQVLFYVKEEEAKAEKERQRIEARVAKGTMKDSTAADKLDNIKDATASVKGGSAKMNFRKVPKIRIAHPELIPREYLIPDEDKIFEAVIKNNIEVPGVERYEDTIVSGGR